MTKIILNCWALFLGLGLIMLGSGLQGSLLGIRASIENFDTTISGIIMSGYYLGFVGGSIIVPKLVGHVGHIRCFGAFASLASIAILVHFIFLEPLIWWFLRFLAGFSMSGLFIVTESWLNDEAENDTRGRLLSFYMVVQLGGMAGGQLLLNVGDPREYHLFVLISIMISFALIPILLTVSKAPRYEEREAVSINHLFNVSPLGIYGISISGFCLGSLLTIGPIYGVQIGLNIKEISFIMSSLIVGGFISQYPLGWLSDIRGRREIIIGIALLGAFICFFTSIYALEGFPRYLMFALIGSLSIPLYSLSIAYTNDYLTPSQMVAASGGLVLSSSIGASSGPIFTSFLMDAFGPNTFLQTIASALLSVAIFALWRATRRHPITGETVGDFGLIAPSPINAAFNPTIDLAEIEASERSDGKAIEASFEELAEELNSKTKD